MQNIIRHLSSGASVGIVLLILLCTLWETMLAPLRPGGSLLVLKTIPLLFALPGILKGKRYTYQWAPMLVLIYFTEGIVRAWSETGISQLLAWIEIILSLVFFLCSIFFAKLTKKAQ